MSRGLGTLQRRILETLEEAKAGCPRYRGTEWHAEKYWVVLDTYLVTLPPGVYDLRCSAAYLARVEGRMDRRWPSPSFTACFSRAAHGLVDRGLLRRLCRVPVASIWLDMHEKFYHGHEQIWHGVDWPPHPRRGWQASAYRFVTLSANPYQLALSTEERLRLDAVDVDDPDG